MTERVDIANLALTLLGEEPITSLEDDLKRAKVLKLHYAPARDATLEAFEWSFARKRFKPAKLLDVPLWGYDYAFEIPPEILRVTTVERDFAQRVNFRNDGDRPRNQVNHEVENGAILADWGDIYCVGIRRMEDEGEFSPLFVHAFAAKLALFAAYAITESNEKFNNMAALYKGAIDEASSRDGAQSSTRRLRSNTMKRAR